MYQGLCNSFELPLGPRGSGRGRKLTPEELKRLEQIAKDSLKKAAEPTKYNVFFSFAYEDLNDVNLLHDQAKNENSNIKFNEIGH